MFRQTITFITLACFVWVQCGCMTVSQVPKEKLPEKPNYMIVKIVKTDGRTINFVRIRGYYGQYQPKGKNSDEAVIAGYTDLGAYYYIEVPVTDIQTVYIERFDPAKSIIVPVAVTFIAVLLVAAIIAATKESCPFVYSYDGQKYIFDGEPYGGAICEALKRTDYCQLEHLRPVDNQYRLKLTNEVDETQYTDEFRLWVVDHSPGMTPMLDAEGNLHSVVTPQSAFQVADNRGNDLSIWLSQNDDLIWESKLTGRDPNNPADLRDTLTLTFPKPTGANQVKLCANVGTTLWGSQMLKRMSELRGKTLQSWHESLLQPEMRQMLDAWGLRENLYILNVQVLTANGWETRGEMLGGGPFVLEDRVVTLDLGGVSGDTLTIRLTPPAGFWQMNWLAVDYSPDVKLPMQELTATSAKADDGTDQLGTLSKTDNLYYAAPQIGQFADLTFAAPDSIPSMARSVFAKVSGYYDIHVATTEQEPQTGILGRISFEPGYATAYSLQEFFKWQAEEAAKMAGKN